MDPNTAPNNQENNPSTDLQKPEPQFVQPKAATPQSPTQTDAKPGDQKSRLAMMSFAFFAGQFGVARIYIGDKIGLVRLWASIASIVLSVVPLLNILTGLALMALTVWGIVDFFLLKNRTTDSAGQPLYTTERDDKTVRILTIVFIVSLILVAVLTILAMSLLALFFSQGMNFLNESQQFGPGTFEYNPMDNQDSFQPST